jgi:hypothetical protein
LQIAQPTSQYSPDDDEELDELELLEDAEEDAVVVV